MPSTPQKISHPSVHKLPGLDRSTIYEIEGSLLRRRRELVLSMPVRKMYCSSNKTTQPKADTELWVSVD